MELFKAELRTAREVVMSEIFQRGWRSFAQVEAALESPSAVVKFLGSVLDTLLDEWEASVQACRAKDNRGARIIADYDINHKPVSEDPVIHSLKASHKRMKKVVNITITTVCS